MKALAQQKEIDQFVDLTRKDADKTLKLITKFEISNPAEYAFACNALKEIAYRHDVTDAKRKELAAHAQKVIDEINATFKAATEPLKDGEAMLREKLGAYVVACTQKRATLLRQASTAIQAGNSSEAEVLIAEAEKFMPTKVEGVSVKAKWTGDVIDPEAIPREYLVPNIKALEQVTQQKGYDPEIPGWRAYPTGAVRTSRKGGVE